MKKVLSVILIVVLLFICGCTGRDNPSSQRLYLSAVADPESRIYITKEELNGNYDDDLYFLNVKDVIITLDKKSYPLEDAIAEGHITVEELLAYARIDAKNGFCKEIAGSHNGVSHFIYRYQGICDLYFTHDVYETPDGKNHILNHFTVYNNGGADNAFYTGGSTLYNVFQENYPIDQEDWKLKFETADITPSGFTLKVHQGINSQNQSKSQHIGQLYLSYFDLYDLETMECYSYTFEPEKFLIVPNATSTFTMNFFDDDNSPQTLPSGNYRMFLCIQDQFDEEDVHPLMRDYHDLQSYWVDIEIP